MGMVVAKNLMLFNLRKVKGWTQIEAARELGIPISVYQRIEEGKLSGKIENWEKVQNVYEIPDEEMWKVIKGKVGGIE